MSNLLNNKITDEYGAITKPLQQAELEKFIADDYQKVKGMYIPDEDKYNFVLVTKYNKDNVSIKELIAKLKPMTAETQINDFATSAIVPPAPVAPPAVPVDTKHIYLAFDKLNGAIVGYLLGEIKDNIYNITKVEIFNKEKEKEIANMLVKKYILNTYNGTNFLINNIYYSETIYNAFAELNFKQCKDGKFEDPQNIGAPFQQMIYYFQRDTTTLIDPSNYPLVKATYDYIAQMYEKSVPIKDIKDVCPSYPNDISLNFTGIGDVVNQKCIKSVQAIAKGGTNSAKAGYYSYWLKNFLPSNFVFQPTLSGVGQKQAEKLGEALGTSLADDNTVIITSASVRAMMTAYLAAAKAYDKTKKPITIYVVPYINEKENDAQFVFDETNLHDFSNYGIHPDIIDKVGDKIEKVLAPIADTAPAPSETTVTFDYSLYQGARDTLLATPDAAEKQKLEGKKTALRTAKEALTEAKDKQFKEDTTPPTLPTVKASTPLTPPTKIAEAAVKTAEEEMKKAEEDLKKEIETNSYYKAKLSADEQVRQADLAKFFAWFQATQASDASSPFINKSQIVAFCHGYVIKELHEKTGIDKIKEHVKKIYATYEDNDKDKREMFKTWDANTAVFKHPYFTTSPGGGLLKGLDPITNACLVRDNIELEQVKKLMDLTADLNEVKVEKVKNEKELAKIDPKEKITGAGKDLKPIYKYLLDTLDLAAPAKGATAPGLTAEELEKDIDKLMKQTKVVDDLNPEKEKEKADKTAKPGAGDASKSYTTLSAVLKADFENSVLEKVYEALKSKYLTTTDLIRSDAVLSLLPEDKFDNKDTSKIISLSPGSLRGDIALITHGYNENEAVDIDLTDRILGITFKKAQVIKEPAVEAAPASTGGKAKRKFTGHKFTGRKYTRRIKKHIKKYTKKNNKKKNKKSSKTKRGKKNKKHKYTR